MYEFGCNNRWHVDYEIFMRWLYADLTYCHTQLILCNAVLFLNRIYAYLGLCIDVEIRVRKYRENLIYCLPFSQVRLPDKVSRVGSPARAKYY